MDIVEKIKDMVDADDEGAVNGLLVSGAAVAGSLLTKRLIGYIWKNTMKTDPPKNPADRNVSWKEAVIWSLITGVVASMVKLLVRRNVVIGAKKA